jgi:hypothetical protein
MVRSLAPDGTLLSHCDAKKAMWYVRKGIATTVRAPLCALRPTAQCL